MNVDDFYTHVSPLFRRRRMRRFLQHALRSGAREVLDVGGTPEFWSEVQAAPFRVTLLNQDGRSVPFQNQTIAQSVIGDGCRLPFADKTFDVVFSNSVIEHVGDWERQQMFACEVSRVGRQIWIQTPAKEFPIEPHLLTPCVHWLPTHWQLRLLPWLSLRGLAEGWHQGEADAFLREVRLITIEEMKILFPHIQILRESFLGVTKSYVALSSASTHHEPPRAD